MENKMKKMTTPRINEENSEMDFEACCSRIDLLLAEVSAAERRSRQEETDLPQFFDEDASDTLSQGWCIHCGEKTFLPMLCISCVDSLDLLPASLRCDWYIDRDLCAALLECDGGKLEPTKCRGMLRACEQKKALLSEGV